LEQDLSAPGRSVADMAAADAAGGPAAEEAPFLLRDSAVTMVSDRETSTDFGSILKRMDRAACLSAEMLAQMPCVTLSMDDLTVFGLCPSGHRLLVTAVVTRAFNSSMEVQAAVYAVNKDHRAGSRLQICESFFTFVAQAPQGPDGKRPRVRLRKAVPSTDEARADFHLASERRKVRFKEADTVQAAVAQHLDHNGSPACDGCDADPASPAPCNLSDLDFEMMEIVFPQHTQHHGTTFGGVIMSWAVTCGLVCAEKYEMFSAPTPYRTALH